MIKAILPIFITFLTLFCTTSMAHIAPRFRSNEIQFHLMSQYYLSTANYDKDTGTFSKLTNNQSFEQILFDINTSYAFHHRWNVFSRLNIAYARSRSATATRDNSGLNEFDLGMHYKVPIRWITILPEVKVTLPIYTFEPETDDVLIGEGVMAAQYGLWLRKRVWDIYLFSFAGVQTREGGLSDFAIWKLGMRYRRPKWAFGLMAEGFSSITDDEYLLDPTKRTVITDRVNAGSLRYHAVNPVNVSGRAWVDFHLSRYIAFHLATGKSINGTNSASGWSVYGGFTWRIPMTTRPTTKARERERKQELEEFQIKSEIEYQNLFKRTRSDQLKDDED